MTKSQKNGQDKHEVIDLIPEYMQDGNFSNIQIDARKSLRWGVLVLMLGFGGFVAWAAFAPLDAGIHASGQVKVADNRKTIQHLTGGIVDKILVKEGQQVHQGQVLVEMNATRAQSEQGVVIAQYIAARTVEARLLAERDNLSAIKFDPELEKRFAGDARLAEAMALQVRLFHTRKESLRSEINILRENLAASESQLKGMLKVQQSRIEQRGFLDKELEGVRALAKEGYVPRNRMFELERSAAELAGAIAEDYANVGRTRNQIAELKLRILQRTQEQQKEVQSQLTDIQKEATALADRLGAIDYEVSKTLIRSPINGSVVGLRIHTVGGIIRGGAPLMDVVPVGDPLLVEARVPVQAIDKIYPNLPVEISFPAFSHAQTPNIPGKVLTISADSLTDEATHQSYYLAQIQVTPEGMTKLSQNHVRPGMPADVVIKTGERTMLNYLIKPLSQRLNASFKEQ